MFLSSWKQLHTARAGSFVDCSYFLLQEKHLSAKLFAQQRERVGGRRGGNGYRCCRLDKRAMVHVFLLFLHRNGAISLDAAFNIASDQFISVYKSVYFFPLSLAYSKRKSCVQCITIALSIYFRASICLVETGEREGRNSNFSDERKVHFFFSTRWQHFPCLACCLIYLYPFLFLLPWGFCCEVLRPWLWNASNVVLDLHHQQCLKGRERRRRRRQLRAKIRNGLLCPLREGKEREARHFLHG